MSGIFLSRRQSWSLDICLGDYVKYENQIKSACDDQSYAQLFFDTTYDTVYKETENYWPKWV